MTNLFVAVLLPWMLHAVGAGSYAEAHEQNVQTGRPLVVLVGADWCPACVRMKGMVLPEVAKRGVLNRVAFATVDADRERTLAQQLMRGGSIPQLIMYYKTPQGWRREQLTGAQSAERIEAFLREGIEPQTAATPVRTQ